MAIELDVDNKDGALAPGMFPQVTWPVVPDAGAVLVPATAVVTTTERTFVVRIRDGRAEVGDGTARGCAGRRDRSQRRARGWRYRPAPSIR